MKIWFCGSFPVPCCTLLDFFSRYLTKEQVQKNRTKYAPGFLNLLRAEDYCAEGSGEWSGMLNKLKTDIRGIKNRIGEGENRLKGVITGVMGKKVDDSEQKTSQKLRRIEDSEKRLEQRVQELSREVGGLHEKLDRIAELLLIPRAVDTLVENQSPRGNVSPAAAAIPGIGISGITATASPRG
jgi:hypothetical protein